jgi:hypothetical protein
MQEDWNTAKAQDTMTVLPLVAAPQPQEVLPPRHYLAWGISSAVGDLNLGDDRGDLLFSMLFARRLNKTTELEYGLHYIAVHKLQGADGFAYPDSATYTAIAWQGDVAWTFQPFGGFFERFRFGIGPSVRFLTALTTWGSFGTMPLVFSVPGKPDTIVHSPALRRTQHFQGLGLGALIKVEYIFPLAPAIDLIVRAQLHSYIPPIILVGSSDAFDRGVNLGSAGIFLRVAW